MLTPDQIERLEAGPEMDRYVAMHIFGCVMVRREYVGKSSFDRPVLVHSLLSPEDREKLRVYGDWREMDDSDRRESVERPYPLPAFSTDIAAAWRVVEKFSECDECRHQVTLLGDGWSGWTTTITYLPDHPWSVRASASTAPLSICKAALLAVLRGGEGGDSRP